MKANLAVLAAALCFGTTGTAMALADVAASPISVGAARVVVGGALLALISLISTRSHVRSSTVGTTRTWPIILVGALGVVAYQPAFFAGTRLNGVAIGTVIALGSAPVATGILGSALSRALPSRRWLVATAIAVAGVFLTAGISFGGMAATPLGLLASMGAGVSYAAYTLASKRLLTLGIPPRTVMGRIFGAAALLSLPLLTRSVGWIFTPRGTTLVLWLGLVTTALAYTWFGWGLSRLSANRVATLTLAEPVAATLLGVVLLGEALSRGTLVGILLIVVGLLLLASPPRTARLPHQGAQG